MKIAACRRIAPSPGATPAWVGDQVVELLRVRPGLVLHELPLRRHTARAGNRRFWCLSALRSHTKAPYKTDLHRKTLRELKRPGGPGQHVALPALAAVLTEGGGPAPPPSLRGGARAHPEAVRGGRHPRIVAAPVLAI
jgi:hypothetical protein